MGQETQELAAKTQELEPITQVLAAKTRELPESLLREVKALGKRPSAKDLRRVIRMLCSQEMTPADLASVLGKTDVANLGRAHATAPIRALAGSPGGEPPRSRLSGSTAEARFGWCAFALEKPTRQSGCRWAAGPASDSPRPRSAAETADPHPRSACGTPPKNCHSASSRDVADHSGAAPDRSGPHPGRFVPPAPVA
jgi:hypothetical protein